MTSYGKPTDEQLDAALPLLSSPQHEAYFFARLENPNWIDPLAQRGIFKYPPKGIELADGSVRFPQWPASRYLARMALHAPDAVASVFAAIETDNSSVLGDMVKAALVMPPSVSSSLVPRISRAAKEGTLWIYLEDASDLCVRLTEGGETNAAMALATALFAPTFEGGHEEPRRRDLYWYKEGLEHVVPPLARTKPRQFLPKLCDWLRASILAMRWSSPQSDHSCFWRPAIEEHEQNSDHDFAAVMVGFVRIGFEEAIRAGGISLPDALQILYRYAQLVFRRIEIHLIAEFADQNTELVRETILRRELFDSYEYKHEYARLVGLHLDILSDEERNDWFGWVDSGPDMSDFDESVRTHSGREPTEQDRQDRIQWWQFERLHWVREHLEGERRDFYESMRSQHGEPPLADLNYRSSSGWVGDESPMSFDQLAAMTFEEAAAAISSWKPNDPWFTGPNRKGLASTFEQYVASTPEAFSAKAQVLIGRPAIFVRAFISQMSEAVRAGRHMDVGSVLDLCWWVVQRPVEEQTTPREEGERLVDENWQWTRDEISRFIDSVCRAESESRRTFPLDYRSKLWTILERLCRDDPTSYIHRDLADDDPRVHDYLDLGINSPRGKAVGAALEYARWVANHIKQSEGTQEIVPGGFDAIPEVRTTLEWQIAPENRSVEVMSVIGSQIGLIYWIDREWLSTHVERIFRLADIEKGRPSTHGWAAWNAFLVWVRPHIEFYRLFRSQFAYAVEQASIFEPTEHSREQPMYHLGEHLMVLYGRGQLGLDDDDQLLRRFLTAAASELRRHAIAFVGHTLEAEEGISVEIIARFQIFWEEYWSGPGPMDARESRGDWLFGTWFASKRFPESWALDQLRRFVEVNPTPEPDRAVVQTLAGIAHVDIRKSVEILDLMVRGDREGWRIEGWGNAPTQILELGLSTRGAARDTTVRLIDYLGRRGYAEFGRLLASGPPNE